MTRLTNKRMSAGKVATAARAGPSAIARRRPRRQSALALREKIGVCQWFHFQDYAAVDRSIALLSELGVKHLRTGISWADYYRSGGAEWYDWQMKRLQESKLEILLSVWHTPPSIAESPACSAPPKRLRDYADFIDLVITRYGDAWHHLELWNEPNNRMKWDFPRHDPDWSKFARMIGDAAYWARQCGRHTVLGGMIPVDHHWLNLMRDQGVLQYIDVVGIHAFPGMWFPHHPNWDWHRDWKGWDEKLSYIRAHAGGRPVWVTETGTATWDLARACEAKEDLQAATLDDLAGSATGERFYFYCLFDLDPSRDAIEGFHVDENEYHMGLVTFDGRRKQSWHKLYTLLNR